MATKRKSLKKAKKQLYFVRLPNDNLGVAGYNGAGREGVTEASNEIDAVGHVVARFTRGGRVGLVSYALDKASKNGRAEYACMIPEVDDRDSEGIRFHPADLRMLREMAFAESLATLAGNGEHPINYVKEARRIFSDFGI
ncbi:hypothetical protein J4402_00655 [Candidatus Pacearchaeota archaeon]|nr:hypothetical protein [Candidatus Pacearchaeota archaeon]